MAFVHPEDVEPTVALDDQDTDGNDHDFVALTGEADNVSTRVRGSPGGSSSTPGVSPHEHTLINQREEEGARDKRQYGRTGQNAAERGRFGQEWSS